MLFVCPKYSPGGPLAPSAPSAYPVSAEFPGGEGAISLASPSANPSAPHSTPSVKDGGANPSEDPNAWYLPDDAVIRVGRPHSHYRAKMFIPCIYGSCPGRMQLIFLDSRKQELKRAFYRCDQNGRGNSKWCCPMSKTETYPEDLRVSYVTESHRIKPSYKSNESLTRDEMETMI